MLIKYSDVGIRHVHHDPHLLSLSSGVALGCSSVQCAWFHIILLNEAAASAHMHAARV